MTALQRGLFRSMSLRKLMASITKNQETSGDDKFMKPPPDKTLGIKNGQYDKLNTEGFVTEETHVTNGDVIFGKVTPIVDTSNNGKIFKCSSEQYKSHADGVVDRMFIGIKNQDGFETRKALIRSERFPDIGDKFCCFLPDHDVLTSDGWVNITKLTLQHKVATLVNNIVLSNGIKNDTLKYVTPTEIQEYDHDGDVYVVDSNQVKLAVTMNHRMWTKSRVKDYEIKEAKDIVGTTRYYKKNVGSYEVENDENISIITNDRNIKLPGDENKNLPDLIINMKSFLIFMGIWYAEGSMSGRGYNVNFAAHKQRVKDALTVHCETMGLEIHKTFDHDKLDKWSVIDRRFAAYFKPLSVGSINKTLPKFVWKLKPHEANWLIDGMLLGDGHTMKNGTQRYDTSSIKLADDLQRLCLHAGYSANIIKKYNAGRSTITKTGKNPGEIITLTVDAWRVTIIKTQNNPVVNKCGNALSDKKEQYKGKVYCCTVPGEGVIYVRRFKVPVWCGNSRHGQKGTMGIGMRAVDMPFTKHGIRPDIIMNTHAVPSRMTIGQLWETLLGKIGALQGINMDGTAFEDYDINASKNILEALGYQRECEEYMYNGMTGKMIKRMIFIGPTFYQRLKHMVIDKIHSRSRGPVTILTRQAAEGRSRKV